MAAGTRFTWEKVICYSVPQTKPLQHLCKGIFLGGIYIAFESASPTSHTRVFSRENGVGLIFYNSVAFSNLNPSVDPSITSRLGWVRGETYFDTYAPALPKEVSHIILDKKSC